jgi:GTP 3',8-cyclase
MNSATAVADRSLVDSFGRVVTDLRISLTDRCNFRCRYCMPPEGLPWMGKDTLLTDDEIVRAATVLIGLGVTSIKLTGGEPLMRRDVHDLVSALRRLAPDVELSMTTNGYLLAGAAPRLAKAGLDRITVSCDSLIRHRFSEITLRDALQEVMRGLEVAAQAGLDPVKINTVVIRGVNEDEVTGFAGLARATGYEVRFIEFMPLDAQEEWDPARVVPGREILACIAQQWELEPETTARTGPATLFRFVDGGPGRVGVIPSVTEPFCDDCNRLRLTADGQLRACLFSLEDVDLRGPLRANASDAELAQIMRSCVAAKWAGHRIGKVDFQRPLRTMSMIGG